MHDRIAKEMPQGPVWNCKTVVLPDAPDEPQLFFHRDIIECAQFILGDPSLSKDMLYAPVEVLKVHSDEEDADHPGSARRERIFSEMNTGRIWNEEQVSEARHTIIIFNPNSHK